MTVGILNICILWEMTSTQGSVYIEISFQIPGLTSLLSTLTAKKSMKMKFSADMIITIFLRRIQRVQLFKIPTDRNAVKNNVFNVVKNNLHLKCSFFHIQHIYTSSSSSICGRKSSMNSLTAFCNSSLSSGL